MKSLMKLFIMARMSVHLQFDINDISQASHQRCSELATEELSGIRDLKHTDAAAANLQIPFRRTQRPSEFSWPLTSITLNLNGDLIIDRRRVSLLIFPILTKLLLKAVGHSLAAELGGHPKSCV